MRGWGVWVGWRSLVVLAVCCVLGLVISPAVEFGEVAFAEGLSPVEGSGETSSSPSLGSALVISGSPVAREQALAVEEAGRENPEAVVLREESRTKFENLDAEQVGTLVSEVFPVMVDDPEGGPPRLRPGEGITGYLAGGHAASVDLGGGRRGVLESLAPIAVEPSPGRLVPIDLSLSEVGGSFRPRTPVVGVSVPKRLGDGVSLPGAGVSLTAVDGSGAALNGSEGAIDGASVLYANTQTDADTVVKPATAGFEIDTVLRSVNSPQQFSFRVGLPVGASLVAARDGSGGVDVVDGGVVIASVLAPSAHDAMGTVVPVSMGVEGSTLMLTVDHRSAEYDYPIVVDPYVEEDTNVTGAGKPTHWKFCTSVSSNCEHEEGPFESTGWGGERLVDQARSKYAAKEWGGFVYQTQGESRIIEFSARTSGENAGSNIESVMQIVGKTNEIEANYTLSVNTNYGESGLFMCPKENCTSSGGTERNIARFQQTATGSGEHFSDTLRTADVEIAQNNGPAEPTFNKTEEHLKNDANRLNVLYGNGAWLGPNSGAFEVHDQDPGIGISYFNVRTGGDNIRHEFFEEGKCSGVQCFPEVNEAVTYNASMADGEDEVEVTEKDLAQNGGYGPIGLTKVKVDGTPPRGLVLNGLPGNGVVNEAEYHLQAEATDGVGTTPSSGVKSIGLYLDGFELPGKSGSCAPGPCTSVGEWAINGETFGAGKHTLTVLATDNAGNVESRPYTITVRHASVLGAGPGSVDPITGAFRLSASDVSIGSAGGSLGVSRSFDSRQLTAGENGPLGSQWSLNISGSHAIEREPTGSLLLIAPDGGLTTFESDGKGGFISPKGDENLVLSAEKEGETVKAYLLKDPALGTTTKYTQPGGSGPWVIASSEGTLSPTAGKETFAWERIEGLTRPKLALAPAPTGVTCSLTVKEPKELSKGCRALSFVYATSTAATGEAPSEWNEYNHRLKEVLFTAENPSNGTMEEKPVAEYAYDKQGRLRAEWDPRISPALKTTYGYDGEGHVVAVNPPGVEPSLLHYGTTAEDTSTGRLLSVTRPPAGTASELKEARERPAPVSTGAPSLSSTSPVIGTTLSIASNGSWSNSPLAYSDSWEDCYTAESKETCTVIPGAVNSTYTPRARDAGYTLRAQVTAVNADGASAATSAASNTVAVSAPAFLRAFGSVGEGSGQFKAPAGEAVDSSGDVWAVDRGNDRVQEWSATGAYLNAYGVKGEGNLQFKEPQGIAINLGTGNVYVADTGNNRIEELNSKGGFVRVFAKKGSGTGEVNAPGGVAVAPNGMVWVGDYANDRVDEFSETGEALGSFGTEGTGNGQFKGPDGIAFSGAYAYVVDVNNDRVQEFSLSGEYVRQFGTKGAAEGQLTTPYGIATEPISGDVYVADLGNNRIEEFNPVGVFLRSYGKKGTGNGEFSSPEQVTVNTTGDVYVSDTGNNRVEELEPKYSTNNPAPEPPASGKSAVSTIEYNVPLWGEGAPDTTAKTEAEKKAELEKWGQTDDPTEATAVFPPDEPMGWPAKDYKRATISYLDGLGHTVNTATPSGGIATSEYNETNDIVRSLSADNRATALKEAKTREASEQLDTKSEYNTEGTQLLDTVGPQHTIELANGSEAQGRNNVHYYYDEGAPKTGTYDLVTKVTDGARIPGQPEEKDLRTTITSYSGQNNLGWTLRKPTSVTTDPSTGPLGKNTHIFGGPGSGNGQFNDPRGIAVAANGNVFVADTKNSRIEVFTGSGEYLKQFGTEGSGKLKEPEGVGVSLAGNVYVADTGDAHVKEFKENGEYVRTFGGAAVGIAVAKPYGTTEVYTVTDGSGDVIHQYTEGGGLVKEYGLESEGVHKPQGIAVGTAGIVYVTATGEHPVQRYLNGTKIGGFATEGSGPGELKEPEGITSGPSGNVYVADTTNSRVEEYSLAGEYLAQYSSKGTSNGQLENPGGIAFDTSGDMYIADTGNSRIEEWGGTASTGLNLIHTTVYDPVSGNVVETRSPAAGPSQTEGAFTYAAKATYGGLGSGNDQFNSPRSVAVAGNGNVFVADTKNSRIEVLSASGEYLRQFGTEGSGKLKEPEGVAVSPAGNVYVADTGDAHIKEFKESGEYIRTFGGAAVAVTVAEVFGTSEVYAATDGSGDLIHQYTESGGLVKEYGLESEGIHKPQGIAVNPKTTAVYVTVTGEHPVQTFSLGLRSIAFGTEGSGNGQLKEAVGITSGPNGNVYVADSANSRVEEFTATGGYLAQYGSKGTGVSQLEHPGAVAFAPSGNMYIADTNNNRIEKWTVPGEHAVPSQTIYYSAKSVPGYPECGSHPEWAKLPCLSQPAAQPEGSLPKLPVTTTTYNIWDEPEATTEALGSTTRTKTMTYDSAARPLGDEETSTADISLPKVTNEYGTETGAMIKQSTTTGETTRTVTGAYNTLGELESYTDADANTSKYTYDIDGRVEEMSDGKGTQSYAYDGTTGVLSKLLDSAAGTFTAGYDVDGKLTSETYPNGMTVKYTDDSTGHATHEEYVKETHCSENCTWFGEGVTYSIHGEALSRASTLAKEEYAYDAAGRLLQVQETSSGKGCTTRLYAYDEDSNRTSLTTREPEAGGKCATTGGTTEAHTYDEADRLNDTGIAYDALGNTTKVPAADAGKAELTSTYYVDNQTASQKQNEETINYGYDPSGRTRETISEGSTKATVIDHYAGPGEAISWISEGPEKWTRNIPGIDGALTATQANGQPAVLQVHDLQGNIVATAAISETETKVLTTYNSTEFGVPVNGTPPTKYSWLGATGLVPETPTGTTVSGGDGYVPQLGRALQTQPVIPPGAFPDGSYNGAPYTTTLEPWVLQSMNTWGAAGPEREASRLTAAREKAEEEANLRQCNQATMCPTPTEGGAEGGNGPGEETFGDPIKCYAGGTVVSSNEEATIAGYGGCNRGLPAGTWIKICVYDWPDSSPYPTGGCSKTIQVKGHTSRYWSMGTTFTARCSEGDIIRGYIAFWVPGGRTLYAGTEQGECGGGDESVWEALTPWQALPGDLG